MGSFSGGGGGGSSDEDEDEQIDEDVTEYGDSANSPEPVEEDDDDSTGVATVAGAAAAGAATGSGSGAGSAGATGGAATAGGTGGSTGDGNGEESDEEDGGNTEAGETTEPEPEAPESETENPESDPQTPEEPKEPEEPERPETEGQDQTDVDEPDDEVEDKANQEDEREEDEDDEDDEEEQKEASISVYTDPWDNTGWGIEPALKHLKQTFGDKLEITCEPGPVRTFDDSDLQAELWRENSQRHEMPINESVWENGGPVSTELSTKAFAAAKEQDEQKARNYLRQLRIAAQVEGTNIEDQNLLLRLAEVVGLNSNQLQMDWDDIDVEEVASGTETPVLHVSVDNVPRTWKGHVEYERAMAAFLGQGMEPEPIFQSVGGFVEEHGPVATEEVAEVFELTHDEAIERLRSNDDVRSEEFDCGTFWKI